MDLWRLLITISLILSLAHAAQEGRRRGLRVRPRPRRPPPPPVYEYYDDDYYYDDEESSSTGSRGPESKTEESADYDVAELVSAWKAYIREKTLRERHRFQAQTKPIVEYECPPQTESYRTPDDQQCDKFKECNIKGEEQVLLCPDGLVFDVKSEHCDYPAKVNCTGRENLQDPVPSKNCPRANGFFPFPANESCQKFWDCREGKAYLQTCPEGVIFDPNVDACVTPDQSGREDCHADAFLGFRCPVYTPDQVLRFGNHDRLASPNSCVEFFSCLKTGQPRLAKCPRKKVFNPDTGHCSDPAQVEGCENYWKDKLAEEYDDDFYQY